jgi:hypothetical protein
MSSGTGTLNEHQQRRLLITCRYIDDLLSSVESILHVSAADTAFPKYITDLSPLQRRTIQDYTARIRARLLEILDTQHIDRGVPSIPVSRAIHSNATFIDIAIAELRPRHMRGYGAVSHEAERDLNAMVGQLEALVAGLDRIVNDGHPDSLKGQ